LVHKFKVINVYFIESWHLGKNIDKWCEEVWWGDKG
jgi:hypothetical protein